jgi:hypothetical protein
VTSRALLHLHGEHVFEVPPLDVPVVDPRAAISPDRLRRSSATRLFVDRAKALREGVRLLAGSTGRRPRDVRRPDAG